MFSKKLSHGLCKRFLENLFFHVQSLKVPIMAFSMDFSGISEYLTFKHPFLQQFTKRKFKKYLRCFHFVALRSKEIFLVKSATKP